MTTRPDNDASGAVSCAVLTLGLALVLAAVASLCVATAVADDGEAERTAEYGPPHDHAGSLDGTRCYHYAPDWECIDMPARMAAEAPFVWDGCEVRGIMLGPTTDAWSHAAAVAAATGALGERGRSQLHPIHRAGMAAAGLDYEDEGDRIRYSIVLWERSGWNAWSCR